MDHDTLDGFRGVRPPALQRAARAASEAEPSSVVFGSYILGVATEKFMAGLADQRDVKMVGVAIVEWCESAVRVGMQDLLTESDLTSREAREAHFNARVAGKILNILNGIVATGRAAGNELANQDGDEA